MEQSIASVFSRKKKKYLSDKIEQLVNELIAAEFNASQLYKALATWCEYTGYEGTGKWMNGHVEEERKHMNKLYEYSLDRQCNPITPAVKQQPSTFTDLKDVLEKALAHEELIESYYKNAVDIATKEKDITSFGLFQWFLGEQIEEIKIFSGLLDRLDIIGIDKRGMFFLDQEISEL